MQDRLQDRRLVLEARVGIEVSSPIQTQRECGFSLREPRTIWLNSPLFFGTPLFTPTVSLNVAAFAYEFFMKWWVNGAPQGLSGEFPIHYAAFTRTFV